MKYFSASKSKFTINLDLQKARLLRGVINSDKYAYMYDIDDYYKICTIMDRLEDTVDVLNNFTLNKQTSSSTAVDFISWINYADLLLTCIKELNDMYVKPNGTTFFEDKNIKLDGSLKGKQRLFFSPYYDKRGNDDLFFSYIRSMVLAHSIKIDCNKFKDFHQGKYVYTPLVRWNNNYNIEITFYSPQSDTSNLHTEKIELEILNIFAYVKSRFGYLDTIFTHIKCLKEKHKAQISANFTNELSTLPQNTQDKLSLIKHIYSTLGDIDARNGADLISSILSTSLDILSYNFSTINKVAIDNYIKILNSALDDFIERLKTQDFSGGKIFNLYAPDLSFNSSVFSDCEYEMTKIVSEYDYIHTSYIFEDLFDRVKVPLLKIVTFDNKMSNEEKAYLCVIARCLDINAKNN